MTRILSLATVALTVACSDQELLTDPGSGLVAAASVANSTTAQTIGTDKPDYLPGEPVMMYGAGWEPGETVVLTLTEDPQIHSARTYTVTADSLGSFEFDGFAPEAHHAGIGFVLRAVGQSSGLEAETTFTDSIALESFSSNTNGAGGANPSRLMLMAPATAAGQLLIAQITVAKDVPANEVICPPAGWTLVLRTKHSNTGTSKINQEIYYHVATANELMQTYTWVFKQNNDCSGTNSPARGAAGGIIRYSGVDVSHPSGPIEGFAGAGTGSGSSSSATAPSVPATAGARVIRFFGAFKNTSFTPATSPPRIYSMGSPNNSTERTAAAFDATLLAGPSTGTFTAGIASSAEWLAQTIALRMAVACTAPAISVQPSSVSKTIGESATFSVTATGTAALSYQWRKNASDIPGADADTYTIDPVQAAHAGDYSVVVTNACGSATSDAATLTVTQRSSSTTVTASPSPSVFGQSVTFEATVSAGSGSGTPTGSVSFIEGGTCESPTTTHANGVALSGGEASFNAANLAVGSHTIIACYSGDDEFASSDDDVQHTVNKASTSTAVNSSDDESVFSQQVTFTATVSVVAPGSGTPSGNVSFERGGTACGTGTTVLATQPLAGGQAQFSTSGLAVGSHIIRACYGGDGNFNSSGGSVTQTVEKASTTTGVTSSQNPSVFGQQVTFTATVSEVAPATATPAGNVTFKEGTCEAGTTLASTTLNGSGQAAFSISTLDVSGSPHTITACYAGNPNFNGSSGSFQQTVNKASTTTSITSVSPPGSQYVNGQVTVEFSVAVVPPGAGTPSGNIEVKNGSTVLCFAALPDTSCDFTPTAVGLLSLVASYVGDDNFETSASAATPYTVKYKFLGFSAPVDRPNILNVSKAGQAIPLKWQLLDANDDPVTNLTAVTIKIGSLACNTNPITDLIEEYASGASGLQNHGDGYYQFNWKTPTTYANSCRSIGLDFGNGYVEWPLANFSFKK